MRKKLIGEYMLITIGTALMALSFQSVFGVAGIVTGGFSGIGIIFHSITQRFVQGGIPIWITTMVLNIPLFIVSIRIRGLSFMSRSLYGATMLSVWLAIFPTLSGMGEDLVLVALYGGVLQGVGIGLVLLGRGTTGGTDTMAALFHHRLRRYTIPQIMQVIDGVIVAGGMAVFGVNRALYAMIAIFVITRVSDAISLGNRFSRAVFIISDQYGEIAGCLMTEVGRGVTGIHVRGMYADEARTMLFCVVSRKQVISLKDIVSRIDSDAFIIVTDAREVLGEGFNEAVNKHMT